MRKSVIVGVSVLALLAAPLAWPAEGDAAKGKEIFDSQCSLCHFPDKEEKKMGPGLKGLFKKEKLHNGAKPTDESVTKIIKKGGNGMPPYEAMLSAEEISHLLAYLKTL